MAGNTAHWLSVALSMNNTKFKQGLKGSQKAMKGFQSQIGQLKNMIIGTFAVGALVNFGKNAIELSSKMEGVKTAFDQLNNPNLLSNLQKATRGTVDNLTLMQYAVRAQNFKIPLEQLATYFQFATQRALQTGESVDYLVESIINGIGRKSTLVMDNLGISAAELQAEIKKTGDFGQAAGNIISKALEETGTVADTTAVKIAQLKTEWQNFKTQAGGPIIDFLTRELQLFTDLRKIGQSDNLKGMTKFNAWFESDFSKVHELAESTDKVAGGFLQIALNSGPAVKGLDWLKNKLEEIIPAANIVATELPKILSPDKGLLNQVLGGTENIADFNIEQMLDDLFSAPNIDPNHSYLYSLYGFDMLDVELAELSNLAEKEFNNFADVAKIAARDVNNDFSALTNTFQNFFQGVAQGIGQSISHVGEMGRQLDRLGQMILKSLGQLLIMTGIEIGFPGGLPFIIAGLAFLGIGAAAGAIKSPNHTQIGMGAIASNNVTFTIKGNDLVGAYDRNINLNNKI